ncbi:MAG: hypothetical protein WDO16_05215 [Bacteroidota bacterium]
MRHLADHVNWPVAETGEYDKCMPYGIQQMQQQIEERLYMECCGFITL